MAGATAPAVLFGSSFSGCAASGSSPGGAIKPGNDFSCRASPICEGVRQLPARATAESPTYRASVLAEAQGPGIMPQIGSSWISFHTPAYTLHLPFR
jgi:hypothetical protein